MSGVPHVVLITRADGALFAYGPFAGGAMARRWFRAQAPYVPSGEVAGWRVRGMRQPDFPDAGGARLATPPTGTPGWPVARAWVAVLGGKDPGSVVVRGPFPSLDAVNAWWRDARRRRGYRTALAAAWAAPVVPPVDLRPSDANAAGRIHAGHGIPAGCGARGGAACG